MQAGQRKEDRQTNDRVDSADPGTCVGGWGGWGAHKSLGVGVKPGVPPRAGQRADRFLGVLSFIKGKIYYLQTPLPFPPFLAYPSPPNSQSLFVLAAVGQAELSFFVVVVGVGRAHG